MAEPQVVLPSVICPNDANNEAFGFSQLRENQSASNTIWPCTVSTQDVDQSKPKKVYNESYL